MNVLVLGEHSGTVRDAFIRNGQNRLGPSEDRWKLRSKFYTGWAQAMADQWGGLDTKP